MKSFLMCPPHYYGIKYKINPWMDIDRPARKRRAEKQWEELYHILAEVVGSRVELIEPGSNFPDMVFTANAGLVFDKRVILSNFRYRERQGEAPLFEVWFRKKGYRIHRLPPEMAFEGAGDALFCGENLFMGYIFRSEARCHPLISDILGKRVLTLELVDPRFYHLDTCFCPVNEEVAIYYPEAFDDYARKTIETFVPNPLPVIKKEALAFACNAVVVGDQVILGAQCPSLANDLSQRGFKTIELDLSEFMKAGGSAKCLTLEI